MQGPAPGNYFPMCTSHCALSSTVGRDFGKAFDIPQSLEGCTFFAAVVLKVKRNNYVN